MLTNPRYCTPTTHAHARISCYTCQNFLDRGKACIIPSRPLLGISSGYQTYSAYANIAQTHANESTEVVSSATKRIYWDDPLQLLVPYQYFWELAGEPSDNAFLAILFFLSVEAIFVAVIGVRLWMLRAQCKNASLMQSSLKKVALTSKNAKDGTNISCSTDTDGIPFGINNSPICIICNDRSQFVGNLRAQESSVETSHGTACSNYVVTI
jgi:hypothetical protein